MGQDAQHIREEIAATRERMGETVDAIGYKADVPSRMRENVDERIESVRSRAADAIGSVTASLSGTGGDAASRIREKGREVTDRIGAAKSLPQNPIGLAVSAFAVGLILGGVAPVTQIEREKLEPLQNRLADKAGTLRDSVVEHGRAVVDETLATATNASREHAGQVAADLRTTEPRPTANF